ncbi:MAG: hypothetical protein AB1705_19375, partial [Verrucomicrobiota bacterium]
LKLWDAETGRELRTFAGHAAPVNACAFSADGRRVLSGAWDNTVKLWDAETGRELRTLAGHEDWVNACAFGADGRRVLSGASDNTLKLWDAETGECLRTFASVAPGEAAVIDDLKNEFVWVSAGAWRHLGWRYHDQEAGRIRILPAEYFGPLPGGVR